MMKTHISGRLRSGPPGLEVLFSVSRYRGWVVTKHLPKKLRSRKKEGVPHRSQFDMVPRINMQHMWRRPSSDLLCDMGYYAYLSMYVRGMRLVTTPTVFHHPDSFCLAGHSLAFHSHLETTLSDRQMQR